MGGKCVVVVVLVTDSTALLTFLDAVETMVVDVGVDFFLEAVEALVVVGIGVDFFSGAVETPVDVVFLSADAIFFLTILSIRSNVGF